MSETDIQGAIPMIYCCLMCFNQLQGSDFFLSYGWISGIRDESKAEYL